MRARPLKKACRFALLSFVAISVSSSGCFRYVPSRAELQQSAPDLMAGVGGEAEFLAYERTLEKQRADFIAKRQQMASNQIISSYQIGSGDLIEFKVYDQPDMTSIERVTPDGRITLPLIGEIGIAGMTLSEARGEIEQQLQKFIRRPQVQLLISEYEAHKVSVVGAVAAPGVYPLKRNDYTLLEVLSKAGGRTPTASNRVIIIPAETGATTTAAAAQSSAAVLHQAALNPSADDSRAKLAEGALRSDSGIEIDLDQLVSGTSGLPLNIPLASGDTIVVPEAGRVEVDGEVAKPGSYPLGARSSMLAAIASAGGLTYAANINQIELIRNVGHDKKAAMVLDLEQIALYGRDDIRLRDGDFIRVPSESGRFRERQVVEVINGIFHVGVGANVR